MTTTETTTAAAARQISEKAAADLQQLRDRIPVLEQTMNALTSEQAELEQARSTDAHTLAHARSQAAIAEQAHNDAVEYANYSIGLLAEHDATRKALEAEAQAKEAKTQYEATATLMEQREATRTARLEALRVEYDQARDELTQAHAKIASIQRIEQQALADLGKSTYERLAQEYQDSHIASIAAAREQLGKCKIEEQRFLDAALTELKAWPHLAEQLKPKELYQDETTQTMQAYVDLINYLIGSEQGSHLAVLQQLPMVRNKYINWRHLFLLQQDDLDALSVDAYHRNSIRPVLLQRRRDVLLRALEEYRNMKK